MDLNGNIKASWNGGSDRDVSRAPILSQGFLYVGKENKKLSVPPLPWPH